MQSYVLMFGREPVEKFEPCGSSIIACVTEAQLSSIEIEIRRICKYYNHNIENLRELERELSNIPEYGYGRSMAKQCCRAHLQSSIGRVLGMLTIQVDLAIAPSNNERAVALVEDLARYLCGGLILQVE